MKDISGFERGRGRRVDVDGQGLHITDYGGLGPTLLLVHGLGGSHANYTSFGPLCSQFGRTLAVDLPGFGFSEPRGDVSLESMQRSVSALVARMVDGGLDEAGLSGVNGLVTLVGNSMGGALCIRLAAERHKDIAALLLVCPALPQPDLRQLDRKFMALLAVAMLPGYDALARRQLAKFGPERLVDDMLRLTCARRDSVSNEAQAAMKDLARKRSGFAWSGRSFSQAARSLVATLSRQEAFLDAMRAVRAPTLLVHGAKDRLVPVRSAVCAVEKVPHWRLEIYGDVGHVPQLEAPARLARSLRSFLVEERVLAPGSVA